MVRNYKMRCIYFSLFLGCIIPTCGFSETNNVVKDDIEQAYDQMEILAETLLQIKKHYVVEKDYETILSGAMHGMLNSLDAYSDFLEPEAYTDLKSETSGMYSGIGIHIGIENGFLTVIAPIEDSPGFKAGLLAGDRIVGIDGEKTSGMSILNAMKKLRGAKGEKVSLLIMRQGSSKKLNFDVIRDNIELPSVKGVRIIRNGIGYIRITQFQKPTAEDLEKAIDKLKEEGMDALVLDLRSNPGGLLKSAVDVSSLFLKKNDLIVTTKGRAGSHADEEYRVEKSIDNQEFPMVILVNGGSASASEIVAGALKDNKRAILVGDTTFGKGSVQTIIKIGKKRDVALRLTIAHYYTPNGILIHKKGIDPDIPVYVSAKEWLKIRIRRAQIENPERFKATEIQEYKDVVDRPLKRALDLLQGIKVFKE